MLPAAGSRRGRAPGRARDGAALTDEMRGLLQAVAASDGFECEFPPDSAGVLVGKRGRGIGRLEDRIGARIILGAAHEPGKPVMAKLYPGPTMLGIRRYAKLHDVIHESCMMSSYGDDDDDDEDENDDEEEEDDDDEKDEYHGEEEEEPGESEEDKAKKEGSDESNNDEGETEQKKANEEKKGNPSLPGAESIGKALADAVSKLKQEADKEIRKRAQVQVQFRVHFCFRRVAPFLSQSDMSAFRSSSQTAKFVKQRK